MVFFSFFQSILSAFKNPLRSCLTPPPVTLEADDANLPNQKGWYIFFYALAKSISDGSYLDFEDVKNLRLACKGLNKFVDCGELSIFAKFADKYITDNNIQFPKGLPKSITAESPLMYYVQKLRGVKELVLAPVFYNQPRLSEARQYKAFEDNKPVLSEVNESGKTTYFLSEASAPNSVIILDQLASTHIKDISSFNFYIEADVVGDRNSAHYNRPEFKVCLRFMDFNLPDVSKQTRLEIECAPFYETRMSLSEKIPDGRTLYANILNSFEYPDSTTGKKDGGLTDFLWSLQDARKNINKIGIVIRKGKIGFLRKVRITDVGGASHGKRFLAGSGLEFWESTGALYELHGFNDKNLSMLLSLHIKHMNARARIVKYGDFSPPIPVGESLTAPQRTPRGTTVTQNTTSIDQVQAEKAAESGWDGAEDLASWLQAKERSANEADGEAGGASGEPAVERDE